MMSAKRKLKKARRLEFNAEAERLKMGFRRSRLRKAQVWEDKAYRLREKAEQEEGVPSGTHTG
jgi:hypothetical protein